MSGYHDYALFEPMEDGIILKRDQIGVHTNVPHVVTHHSPDGYEFGYSGSGPADLALNCVENVLRKIGYNGPKTTDVWDKREIFRAAWFLHQEFKLHFIAPLPREGGMIPFEQVVSWIEERLHDEHLQESPGRIARLVPRRSGKASQFRMTIHDLNVEIETEENDEA